MIIIVEGPDGAGKTQLCKRLSSGTGWPIVHRSNPKTIDEMEEMFAMYSKALENKDNQIWDRGFYSEMAYGPIMRGKSYITEEMMSSLEIQLSKIPGSMVIFCGNDIDTLWERCQRRGETFISNKVTLMRIAMKFEKIERYMEHFIPVLHHEAEYEK